MVQTTSSPVQDSGQDETRNGFRVGSSHDAPEKAGGTAPAADRPKLPPIVWSRPDMGKIMRRDLLGVGEATGAVILAMTALIATSVGIALVVSATLKFLGVDVTEIYNG
ncbi:hypothetical protein [Actinoplanes sp. G11-F43]|uniref:hypothetical protein n=1 Tax=Actinoplanes sp. G11-F43 TaxID=3424130 RepID=UPI003D33FFBA